MSQLIVRARREPQLLWHGEDLLKHCAPLSRRLFGYLLRYRNGEAVEAAELKQEVSSAFRAAWKDLCGAVDPPSGGTDRGSIYSVKLPPDTSDEQALLLLKKVSKSGYLLRVRDDHPDVWVDIWVEGESSAARKLPRYPTRFIGRTEKLNRTAEVLLGLLSSGPGRVMTITGPPGCGKTRFAVELAERVRNAFDRCLFVPLATRTGYDSLASYTGRVLGLRDQAGRSPLDGLKDFIGQEQTLLIFDNCEAHVAACADLIRLLLPDCPGLVVLATSTEPLRLVEEQRDRLDPLSLPPKDAPAAYETLSRFDATALFLERARLLALPEAARPSPASVLTLCRRLDGLPLALEIAAGLVVTSTFTVDEICERLDGRFGVLRRGFRTDVPHHETLRALLDWSHERLSEPARVLLRRMAAFAGPVGLETIEEVCTGDPLPPGDLYAVLTELVDKSLVSAENDGRVTQFNLLETIRLYGRDQLTVAGEGERLRERVETHYRDLVSDLSQSYSGPDESLCVRRIAMEYENIRSVLDREAPDDGTRLHRLTMGSSLWRFWMLQGRSDEGRTVLRRLLAPEANPVVREYALTHNRLSILAHDLGDFEQAHKEADEALKMFDMLDDAEGRAAAQHNLATVLRSLGRYSEARDQMQHSLAYWRAIGNKRNVSYTLNNLGLVHFRLGEFDDARRCHEESLALKREIQDKWGVAYSLMNLGQTAVYQGDTQSARRYLAEAEPLMADIPDEKGVALVYMHRGSVEHADGNYEDALGLLNQGLHRMERTGDRVNIACIRCAMGMVIHRLGRSDEGQSLLVDVLLLFHQYEDIAGILGTLEYLIRLCADRHLWYKVALLWGFTEHLRRAHQQPEPLVDREERDKALAHARAEYGNHAFDSARAEGARADVAAIAQAISQPD